MEKFKVSVIIPVYNAEKYISRCMESMWNQTLQGLEFIFIDDYSTDKSVFLIEDAISQFHHPVNQAILIRNDKNEGVSATRNKGLKKAQGEYIIHCDSDDWVDPCMYEKMYDLASLDNMDVVICDYYVEYKHKRKYCKQDFNPDSEDCLKGLLSGKLHNATWNKLIKKELYVKHVLSFPEDINMWEDVTLLNTLFCYVKSVSYLPEALYHYYQANLQSYTNTYTFQSLMNIHQSINYIVDFYIKIGLEEKYREHLSFLSMRANALILTKSGKKDFLSFCKAVDIEYAYLWKHPGLNLYRKFLLYLLVKKYYKIAGYYVLFSHTLKKIFYR